MTALSKKSLGAARSREGIRKALSSSVLAAEKPVQWDVETEVWTRGELEMLAEELIPGERCDYLDASRAVFVGLIQLRMRRAGTWSWAWLVTAIRRVPETVFTEAAAGSAEADEFVGGLLATPFGVRNKRAMRTMSGLVSASCKIGRYLQKIQVSGDLK